MWRIYYGDGTTFTYPYDGDVEDAPRANVQAIAWNDPERGINDIGRVVLTDWDIFIYSDHVQGWHGTNKYADLLMHIVDHGCGPGGVRSVALGKWIDRAEFVSIRVRANSDELFRDKSARDPTREDGAE